MEKEPERSGNLNGIFVKRPVAILTLSFFISFCVAASFAFFQNSIILWALGALFCLACPFSVVLSIKKRKTRRLKLLSVLLGYASLVLCGVFAALAFYHAVFPLDEVSLYKDKDVYLEFTVTKVSYKTERSASYVAKVTSADGAPESFRVVLDTAAELKVGDTAKAVVRLYEPASEGDFNEKSYCLSMGAALRGDAEDVIVTGSDKSFGIKLEKFNESISAAITSRMSKKSGGVIKAVFLGNKSDIPLEVKRNFSRLGISHLTAISGMHVSFLCAAFFTLSKRIRLGKRPAAFISAGLVILYTALTGFSASAVRAAVICCISSAIMIAGISFDGATALGVCGAGMILLDPFAAFGSGFLLSFSAYAACLAAWQMSDRVFKKRAKKRKGLVWRPIRYVSSSLIFTVTIVLFTLPVTWLYYDATSVLAPLANLIFVPLFSVIMYVGIFLAVLYPVAPVFAAVSAVADGYIRILLSAVEKAASFRNITVSLSYKFAPFIILLAAVCCASLCAAKKRRAVVAFGLGLILCVGAYGAGIFIHNTGLRDKVTVSRTGHEKGDSIIAVTEGKSVLVDVTGGRLSHVSDVKAEMTRLSVTELDCLVITHYTESHAEYISKLAGELFIGKVYLPKPASDKEVRIRDEIYKSLSELDVEVEVLPQTVKIGQAEIIFYENKYVHGEKEPVVSFKINGKSESLLYLGSSWNSLYEAEDFSPEGGRLSAVLGAYGPDPTCAISPSQLGIFDRIYMFAPDFERIERFIYALEENSLYDSSQSVTLVLE